MGDYSGQPNGQAVPDEFGAQSQQETMACIPLSDSDFVRHSLTYRNCGFLHGLIVCNSLSKPLHSSWRSVRAADPTEGGTKA